MNRANHRARYQGRQLLSLMLAICVPAALLYIRIVLGVTASESPVTPQQAQNLNRWSLAALILFFCTQLGAARYLQGMFSKSRSRVRAVLQFIGAFVMGLLFSLTGAMILEAFGWNFLLRFRG